MSSDGQGWSYLYDSWGRLYQAAKTPSTQTYAYDTWGRMTEFKKDGIRKGFYEYFGDGERFKKVVYDDARVASKHITLGGHEVEQLKGGYARY